MSAITKNGSDATKEEIVATPETVTAAPAAVVEIDRIAAETIRVPILGTSPLLMHRFSEKAKRKMLVNSHLQAPIGRVRRVYRMRAT